MTFDDDLRKELQQRLDPIGSPAEWEPVRARMTAARARRDRTRAALAGTVAASLALGGITLAWNERKDPVGTASHPVPIATDDPKPRPTSTRPFRVDARDLVLPAEAAVALPPGRTCPEGWLFFVDPIMHFDVCYPDGWGFIDENGAAPTEVVPSNMLGGGSRLLNPAALPFAAPDDPHHAYPDGTISVNFMTHQAPVTIHGCQPSEPIAVVDGTAEWCEESYRQNADQTTFDPDGERHTLKAIVNLHLPPDIEAETYIPGTELFFVVYAATDTFDENRATIMGILRSVRPHRERYDKEISQSLELLSQNETRLKFQTVSELCSSYVRLDWNETASSVQVRAVGTRPPADHGPLTGQRCPPPHLAQPFVDLKAPLGERRLDFAIVWPDTVVSHQLHCPERYEYADTPRKDVRAFGQPDRAMQAWLDEERPDLAFEDLVAVPVGWRDPPGVVRGYIHRNQGRTLGSFYVEYDFDLDGWRLGETAYCL